jgi:hypothetical protein
MITLGNHHFSRLWVMCDLQEEANKLKLFTLFVGNLLVTLLIAIY